MTCNQISTILSLRAENYSYAKIAEVLGISPDTVKSYCLRHNIATPAIPRKTKEEKANLMVCRWCGKPISNPWNRVVKRFCSDACRTKYQNEQKRIKRLASKPQKSPEKAPEIAGLPAPSELSSGVLRR